MDRDLSSTRGSRAAVGRFVPPPWEAPLDVERSLAEIPATATIAGMYYLAMIEGAKRRGVSLPMPRERYLRFSFYPVAEFARVLLQAAQLFYPDLSLRQGLRRLGEKAPRVFGTSTLGKVTMGSAEGVHATVSAVAKTYSINTPPSRCEVVSSQPSSMILSLHGVYHFLDSHHVGVFEGTLQHVGVRGSVSISATGRNSAEFLLEW